MAKILKNWVQNMTDRQRRRSVEVVNASVGFHFDSYDLKVADARMKISLSRHDDAKIQKLFLSSDEVKSLFSTLMEKMSRDEQRNAMVDALVEFTDSELLAVMAAVLSGRASIERE